MRENEIAKSRMEQVDEKMQSAAEEREGNGEERDEDEGEREREREAKEAHDQLIGKKREWLERRG